MKPSQKENIFLTTTLVNFTSKMQFVRIFIKIANKKNYKQEKESLINSSLSLDDVTGFTRYEKKNYCGYDFDWLSDTTRVSCGTTCSNSPDCQGFAYNKSKKKCCLKTTVKLYGKSFKDNVNVDLYIKKKV